MFINIIKSLEFSSDKILTQNLIKGIFIGSNEKFLLPKNFIIITDEGVLEIARKIGENLIIIKDPSIENINNVLTKIEAYDGILAVGSGSVFDTVKYIAFLLKKPFIGYCTAASMNGYLSSTASLYENGFKKSFKAGLASELYFDLEVIKNAPISLTKAGIGDSLARVSAGNDCLLSHKLKGTHYDPKLFDFRRPSEEFLLENYKLLETKEDEFFLQLIENILFAGIAMHIYGSSFPASGGEHAMAHVAESLFPKVKQFWHGLQISAFTMEMLKIQKEFKQYSPEIKDFTKIFKDLQMPSEFKDLGLSEQEFLEVKNKAITIRERFGYLNI